MSSASVDYECLYDLMPCSRSITGNLFLCAVLGVILAFSAKTIADGSDLLLEVLHPGVIGGFVIPLLGALPDALIILVSGIGSREQVQEEILIGMGTLCGSTIMLLTIAWTGGLFAGRTDIIRGQSVDHKLTHTWNVIRTGVTTMPEIRQNAVIMVVTLVPYFLIQIVSLVDLPRAIDLVEKEDREDEYVMAAFVITCFFFVIYSIYMVFNTTFQENRMKAARRRLVMQKVAELFVQSMHVGEEGTEMLHPRHFQMQDDDDLTRGLLRAANDPENPESVNIALITDQVMNNDNFSELYSLVSKWKKKARVAVTSHMSAMEKAEAAAAGIEDDDEAKAKIASEYASNMASLKKMGGASAELALQSANEDGDEEKNDDKDDDDDDDDDDDKLSETKPGAKKALIIVKACVFLILGAGGAAIFSDPMVTAIDDLSSTLGIQPFYVSFILTPFASNASELIASLYFCAKKSSKSVSVAMAAVYGAVTMNSTLNLGIFLLLMWRQDIYWAFSAEALPMILVVFAIGIYGSLKCTFTTLEGIIIFLLYPLSLGLTVLLRYLGFDTNIVPSSSSSSLH